LRIITAVAARRIMLDIGDIFDSAQVLIPYQRIALAKMN
jgi:hypothetical protein